MHSSSTSRSTAFISASTSTSSHSIASILAPGNSVSNGTGAAAEQDVMIDAFGGDVGFDLDSLWNWTNITGDNAGASSSLPLGHHHHHHHVQSASQQPPTIPTFSGYGLHLDTTGPSDNSPFNNSVPLYPLTYLDK